MNTVEIRDYDWMKTREYRAVHRKNPDPRWWAIVDGMAKPGPKHFEILNFPLMGNPFRFAGFLIEPAAAFVVTELNITGAVVPMRYPVPAGNMLPRSRLAPSMLIPGTETITLVMRNDRREAVPFTVRILEPRDVR